MHQIAADQLTASQETDCSVSAARSRSPSASDVGTDRRAGSSISQMPAVLTAGSPVLALAAIFAILYVAAPILIPITLAIYLNLLFSPLVLYCKRFGVPAPVSAGLLIMVVLYTMVAAINLLAEPAQDWLHEMPETLRSVQAKVLPVTASLEEIHELSEKVDDMTDLANSERVQEVTFQRPNLLYRLVDGLPTFAASLAIVVFLSYLLLAAGDNFLRNAAKLGRDFQQRRRIVKIIKSIQGDISTYLLTVTAINIALGICVGVAMYLLDVPNPLLWGVLAALFNFLPYIGPALMAGVLTLVGLASFDNLSSALLPPMAYAALSILEGQLGAPLVIGERFSLSAAIVFVALVFWGWLWGLAGALIAVPVLLTLKVLCDHVPSLTPVGRFLQR